MRHIITAEERHVFTPEDKSNRKGKKFGNNQRTNKAIAKYQPYAISMTKEEWLESAKASGLSYYRRTRLAELLTFARDSNYQAMKPSKSKVLEAKVEVLEKKVAELEKLISKLMDKDTVEVCEFRDLVPVEPNEPLKPLTVFNADELKALVKVMK